MLTKIFQHSKISDKNVAQQKKKYANRNIFAYILKNVDLFLDINII